MVAWSYTGIWLTTHIVRDTVCFITITIIIDLTICVTNRLPKKHSLAQQSIQLAGIGISEFDSYISAIINIHQLFSGQYHKDGLLPWRPQKDHGFHVLEFTNRYFSPREFCDSEDSLPFGKHVDPYRILSNGVNNNFLHVEDNQVLYFEYGKDDKQYVILLIIAHDNNKLITN